MNYSIHTIELNKYIDSEEYKRVRDLFFADSSKLKYRIKVKGNFVMPLKFNDNGIYLDMDYEPFHGHRIKIRVNPKAVLEPGNLFDIFQAGKDDIDKAIDQANELLRFLGEGYAIENMELKRVDLCVDIHLRDEVQVLELISLAKKSIKATGFHNTYSSEYKRKMTKKFNNENSLDLTNLNRGISFVMYSKYHQLIDIGIEAEKACRVLGVLRVELKLITPFIEGMTNSDLIRLYLQNSKDIFRKKISDLFTRGAYLKLDKAKQLIVRNSERKKYMEILLYIFEKTAEKRSFMRAYKKAVEHFSLSIREKKQVKHLLYMYGINPVTIGVRKTTIAHLSVYSLMQLNGIEEQEREIQLLESLYHC